jgi:hypothetical protein
MKTKRIKLSLPPTPPGMMRLAPIPLFEGVALVMRTRPIPLAAKRARKLPDSRTNATR